LSSTSADLRSPFSLPLLRQLKEKAEALGFDHFSPAPAVIPDRDQAAYLAWCADGLAADLAYMTRDPQKRLHPDRWDPPIRSVLTLGVSYYQGPVPEKPGKGFGRVARYAWGLDYHDVIQERLRRLMGVVNDALGPAHAFLSVDTKPVLERSLAQSAGLGFVGKNTVLIIPQKSRLGFHVGSWVFLAEILLDVPIEEMERPVEVAGCGGCTKCLTACPTDAFESAYRLKSDKCISYLTIENKGWIPREMRARMSDWIFGCDVCQEVCPFNARAYQTRWPEFESTHGVGPWMSLQGIFSVGDQPSFKKKWGHTPLSRSKRRGLVRNACVAAGNSGDESLVPSLRGLIDDAEPLVRGHAVWALAQLASPAEARPWAENLLKKETDPEVRAECEAVLNS
jgi:epoxyqueuosine reductase